MTRETVLVPGARVVEGTLDVPDGGSRACVVASPPHPQRGGHRGDARLRTVRAACTSRGVACLRVGYGAWDRGYGERADVRNALRWAHERYDAVGLFGYSFGASIAALAAASVAAPPAVVALLAPAADISADDLDVVAATGDIDAPLLVVYGERDTTADWRPVVEAARDAGAQTVGLDAGHAFFGREEALESTIGSFLEDALRA